MIGYGPESTHFVLELTYNYGVKSYELGMVKSTKNVRRKSFKSNKLSIERVSIGNDFNGITIQSKAVIERVKMNNYPFTAKDNKYILKSPDGYAFYVVDENIEGAGKG